MTSLRRLRFSRADRRTLVVTADRATLYLARGGRVANSYVFGADEAGLVNFSRYLAGAAESPLAVLVDVVEEEYRQDTLPHVFGADRRAVQERKYARLFRGTRYCLTLHQGREPEGRRDDRVLFTALTKPEIVEPWVALLQEHKVPIAGIFSLPILSRELLPRIHAKGQNVLLISVQSASGLRQTFFRDGQLKISRLAQMPRPGTIPYAAHVLSELDKLRRYLNSLALISREHPLEIYILSQGQMLSDLRAQCRSSEAEHFELIDVSRLAMEMDLPGDQATPYSDAVFVQLLLDATTQPNYAGLEETRYYTLYRSRIGLQMASVLMLLASIGWSGFNFLEGVSYKQQSLDAAQKANFYQDRYAMAHQGLPPTPVEARDLKTAVELVKALERRKGTPTPLFERAGAALERAPDLVLDRVVWIDSADPEATTAKSQKRTRNAKTPQPPRPPGIARFHIATFEGHVAPFAGDYRAAMASVDALVADLRNAPDVVRVEVLAYPLDVRPEANVAGTSIAKTTTFEAKFTLRIVMGVADGARAG